MVACSFILNYFEKKYVLVLMGALGISILFDLIWMIAQAGVRFVLNSAILEPSCRDPTF